MGGQLTLTERGRVSDPVPFLGLITRLASTLPLHAELCQCVVLHFGCAHTFNHTSATHPPHIYNTSTTHQVLIHAFRENFTPSVIPPC